MKIEIKSQYTDILDTDDFVLRHIFECGQCFRWHEAGGEYIGIAGGRAARITQLQNGARITCTKQDFNEFWYDYFDLKRNYADIRARLGRDARMTDAIAFGTGIRILAQEPWEALCSFIISQCNNIPRIQGIIEKLCAMLGDEIVFEGDIYMTFPSAARVAQCTEDELAPLRSGYRAKYILAAAHMVASGELDLDAVAKMPTEDARYALLAIPGVGNKVADCTLLFGLSKHDAFPVDVWMRRALAELLGGENYDFGDMAGIAQQYLFHYMRNGK